MRIPTVPAGRQVAIGRVTQISDPDKTSLCVTPLLSVSYVEATFEITYSQPDGDNLISARIIDRGLALHRYGPITIPKSLMRFKEQPVCIPVISSYAEASRLFLITSPHFCN